MMLSAMRSLRTYQRRGANFRLLFKGSQSRSYKNLSHNLPQAVKVSQKIGENLRVTRIKFHTTRRLDIPPSLALIIRPLVNVLAFLFGRYFKKWWAKLTPEEKEFYKVWFASKRGAFLGILGAFFSGWVIYYLRHLETDPLTHRKRFILLNEQQQEALAKMSYQVHLQEYRHKLVPPNDPMYRRIKAVTKNLINANKDLPFVKDNTWSLDIINSEMKNAYALPGGHIFVFSGIVNMVDNDDQLAIILSHEMAHILLKHPIEQLSRSIMMDLMLIVPLCAIWAMFPDILAFFVQYLAKTLLAVLLSLPYSRKLEKEADEIGLNLAAKACVDVREAVVFWATMKTLVELGVEPVELPWLSTHPDNKERERFLNARLPKALELRLKSGCASVPPRDPRKKFKERSPKELKAIFQARGYLMPDV